MFKEEEDTTRPLSHTILEVERSVTVMEKLCCVTPLVGWILEKEKRGVTSSTLMGDSRYSTLSLVAPWPETAESIKKRQKSSKVCAEGTMG